MKFSGLDKLKKQIENIKNFAQNLDGEIGNVSFDPHDPESIENAISEMNSRIDERVGNYTNDDFLLNLVRQTKQHFREALLEKAAEER
jgi:Mg/Co/Ni transporter MgtE